MKRARIRRLIDAATTGIVTLAGSATIALVVLLLGYLVSVVVPLAGAVRFSDSIEVEPRISDPVLIGGDQNDLIHVLDRDGTLGFFDAKGAALDAITLSERPIDRAWTVFPATIIAFTSTPGSIDAANVASHRTLHLSRIAYPPHAQGLARLPSIEPVLEVPFMVSDGDLVDVAYKEEEVVVAVYRRAGTNESSAGEPANLLVARWRGDSFYGYERSADLRLDLDANYGRLSIDSTGSRVILTQPTEGAYAAVRIQRNGLALLATAEIDFATDLAMLLGGQSLVAARDRSMTQYFVAPRGTLVEARRFEFDQPVTRVLASPADKGFVAQDETGNLHWVHTTTERQTSADGEVDRSGVWSFGAKGDRVLFASRSGVQAIAIDNEHAQATFGALFQRIWYEGYERPSFTWQSSSADAAFEPKFSVVPLVFGTLKAAFYAMLFAAPIGIVAAVYSAYFMPARVRRWVKPGIELMAALPTVVLGFLAGTLLAPAIETNLASVVFLLATVPLLAAFVGYGLTRLAPQVNQRLVPHLWFLTIPILAGYAAFLFAIDNTVESTFFAGDAARWVGDLTGLSFDQRNALVVGIAMAFAVVPVIYSIAEDAIHDVPRSLVNGSLALGASTTQTLLRVVLTTASPGIVSALIIGFGRAVGETMVVLMATGNTPILDWSAFNGLRSLAANLAIELPESEVDSTHYRILFLTALVLFAMTFAFNTAAEVIRTRLRMSYGR